MSPCLSRLLEQSGNPVNGVETERRSRCRGPVVPEDGTGVKLFEKDSEVYPVKS